MHSEIKNPYFFLFWNLILNLTKYLRMAGTVQPIDFIFDFQGGSARQAALMYDHLMKICSPDVRSVLRNPPAFEHDTEVKPLKAADMLAWHVHRHISKRECQPGKPLRHLLDNLPAI